MTVALPEAPEEVEVVTLSPEKVTPMKVSEAIRLGAMASTQITGKLRFKSKGVQYACAIGAASLALGIPKYSKYQYWTIDQMMQGVPVLGCPVSNEKGNRCLAANYHKWSNNIVHMNDHHGLPREWIADFLESIGQ
jgi:hypothetical protein